ncbi:MAG: hypothetical protein RLZZ28_2251 [Bacteroidota bacterium]
MQVTIIGSGNIATVLGRTLLLKGHTVAAVYSRNAVNALRLANELKAEALYSLNRVNADADVVVMAVSDEAIREIAPALHLKDRLVIHTSGALSKDVLKNTSHAYGVLWPVKMVRSSMQTLSPVTLVVDGNNAHTTEEINKLALSLSDRVIAAGDLLRSKMHLVASFSSNFANHLYQLSANFCEKEGLDFNLFLPLISAAVEELYQQHPAQIQTGPALRGDVNTMQQHRKLLEAYPQMEAIYVLLSDSIRKSFHG